MRARARTPDAIPRVLCSERGTPDAVPLAPHPGVTRPAAPAGTSAPGSGYADPELIPFHADPPVGARRRGPPTAAPDLVPRQPDGASEGRAAAVSPSCPRRAAALPPTFGPSRTLPSPKWRDQRTGAPPNPTASAAPTAPSVPHASSASNLSCGPRDGSRPLLSVLAPHFPPVPDHRPSRPDRSGPGRRPRLPERSQPMAE